MVIKRGKAISGHKNHKNKGYPAVVYATPATLNEVTGNIAVTVFYGGDRRVHSLRVLTPNGNEFILAKMKDTEKQNGGSDTKNTVGPPINSVPNDIIHQNSEKTTPLTKENQKIAYTTLIPFKY